MRLKKGVPSRKRACLMIVDCHASSNRKPPLIGPPRYSVIRQPSSVPNDTRTPVIRPVSDKFTSDDCRSISGDVSATNQRESWPYISNIPEHTPSKQSKIDPTCKPITQMHTISTSDHLLQFNTEGYIGQPLDLESIQFISQCPDSGIQSESYASSRNVSMGYDGQTSGASCTISQHAATKTTSATNRQTSLTMCSVSGDDYTNTSTCVYSEANGSEKSIDFPTCLNSQNSGTSYRESQLPASLLGNDSIPKIKNPQYEIQGYPQGTQLDPSYDPGYGSHSTESSYQGADSQREGSVMEQGSEIDHVIGKGSAGDNYLHGENELEDLLYHFQNFFRNRFESEFRNYQTVVSGIIQEQQNHVRQIINAVREHTSSQRSYTDELLSEDTDKKWSMSQSVNQTGVSCTGMPDMDLFLPVDCTTAVIAKSSFNKMKEETVIKRLLDLLTLSCSVSTLLAKAQFKS